jgi:hypothetical protein
MHRLVLKTGRAASEPGLKHRCQTPGRAGMSPDDWRAGPGRKTSARSQLHHGRPGQPRWPTLSSSIFSPLHGSTVIECGWLVADLCVRETAQLSSKNLIQFLSYTQYFIYYRKCLSFGKGCMLGWTRLFMHGIPPSIVAKADVFRWTAYVSYRSMRW